MPFKPIASKDDYPERDNPRRPWDEWGPQEQERNLRKALGDGLYEWLSGTTELIERQNEN